MSTHATPIETLDPLAVSRLLDDGRILLIDVREPAEYAVERIRGALLYPLSTFDATLLPHSGSRRVVFQCGSGKRSLAAAEKMLGAHGGHAAHLGGGLMAWKAAGLPTIPVNPGTGSAG